MPLLAYLKSCFTRKRNDNPPQQQRPRNAGKLLDSKKRLSLRPKDLELVDHQREIIIRKSLASRASSRGTFGAVEDAPQRQSHSHDDYDDEFEERPHAGLKCDWKAFEADLHRNRSTLIRKHPDVDRSMDSSSRQQFSSMASSSRHPPLSNTYTNHATSSAIGVAF